MATIKWNKRGGRHKKQVNPKKLQFMFYGIGGFIAIENFTLTLHKTLVQKRYACSISGHQETLVHF
jgi:hypothetical protein